MNPILCLLKQLVNSTIEDVSLSENVGYDAIVGALNRQIDTQVNWEQVDDLSTVGIDEVAMIRYMTLDRCLTVGMSRG